MKKIKIAYMRKQYNQKMMKRRRIETWIGRIERDCECIAA